MVRGSVGIPLTGIVALFLLAVPAHAAPPPNDAFAAPTTVSDHRTIGSNVDATTEAGEPTHAGVSGGASVWFRWIAPDARRYFLHSCDSDFDTLLAVYTGASFGSLHQVAANDDTDACGPGGEGSFVTFDAVPGRTYSIAVDGRGGEEGTVELALAGWDPQTNDDFASATPIGDVPGDGWRQFSTVSAGRESGEPRHAGDPGGRSIWYSWRPQAPGPAAVWICPADFESLLAVYTGDSVSRLTEVGSSDRYPGCRNGSRVEFTAEEGETYRIAVDGEGGASGQGGLAVVGQEASPVQLVVPDVTAIEPEEGPARVTLTATLSGASAIPLTVDYATRADTAEDGDYEETSGRLVFRPGETVKQFDVVVYPDADEYDDERIWVNLQSAQDLAIWRGHAVIQLYDRDVADNHLCNRLICLQPGSGPLRAHSSGAGSELRKTIPITRRGRGKVVMRLGPKRLRGFGEGDSLEASAEVEVSTTCVDRSQRCVGSRYRYSPKVEGKLVLGPGAESRRGQKVARTERLVCSQKRPHRNHHCVLVFEGERMTPNGPCADCYLKLVLSAANRRARHGDKLVIGADGTRGIEQGKGRINATVIETGAPAPDVIRARRPVNKSIPVSARGGANNPRRVVYAARLDGLKEWEQIAVEARTKVRTGHLPYTTFVGAHLVLSRSRQTPHLGQVEASSVTYGGEFSEKNGFNCTRGHSAHSSPCTIRKVGVVRMRKTANRPLWVHLVVEASAAYGGRWHPGDAAKILRGEMRVRRYGQGGWVSVVPRGPLS